MSEKSEDVKYCRECGQPIHAQDGSCSRCGTEQISTTAPPTQQQPDQTHSESDRQQQPDSGTNWGKIALYGAIAIILIPILSVIIYSFVLGMGAANGPDNTVEEYWQALDKGDIEKANSLSTFNQTVDNESLERVDIEVQQTEIQEESDDTAEVYAKIEVHDSVGASIPYEILHELEKQDGEWIITGFDMKGATSIII